MIKLFEGLEKGDLKRLVHSELHIDEFKSKLGDDEDVVVVSLKIRGKEPAHDLVSFVEKGYEWVIDADVSSGEMDDGDYIVFIEIERNAEVIDHIVEMMEDLMNVCEQETSEWRVRYYTSTDDNELTIDSLTHMIPSSPEAYRAKFKTDEQPEESDKDLDSMRNAAGVEVKTKAPKNDFTESLRIAAGIR